MRPFFYLSPIPFPTWTYRWFCPDFISYNIHMFRSFIRCPVPVYVPISWVIQDNRFLFALPCRSYPPGQKCIIGKNVQKFFWWSEFLLSDAPLLQVIIAGTSKKTGAEIKKLSHLPASIFQISRSVPSILYLSTNDYFLNVSFPVTYWKISVNDNIGDSIGADSQFPECIWPEQQIWTRFSRHQATCLGNWWTTGTEKPNFMGVSSVRLG